MNRIRAGARAHARRRFPACEGRLNTMSAKILIIEDDPDTARLVGLYLQREGHRVLSASDGADGLRQARASKPDLVVLDLMLPGMSGMDICRELRSESTIPIVMLTARVEEADMLGGLESGADDYVTKPFSPRVLVARIKAVLRRTAREALEHGPEEISHGDLTLDLKRRSVSMAGKATQLTPTEFRLLSMFMREPGRTFTRGQIIDRVFGYDFDGYDRTVDAHVANLRKRLSEGGNGAKCVHTVYGVGYRFGDA